MVPAHGQYPTVSRGSVGIYDVFGSTRTKVDKESSQLTLIRCKHSQRRGTAIKGNRLHINLQATYSPDGVLQSVAMTIHHVYVYL